MEITRKVKNSPRRLFRTVWERQKYVKQALKEAFLNRSCKNRAKGLGGVDSCLEEWHMSKPIVVFVQTGAAEVHAQSFSDPAESPKYIWFSVSQLLIFFRKKLSTSLKTRIFVTFFAHNRPPPDPPEFKEKTADLG